VMHPLCEKPLGSSNTSEKMNIERPLSLANAVELLGSRDVSRYTLECVVEREIALLDRVLPHSETVMHPLCEKPLGSSNNSE
jgi:hypothetical protein